MLEAAVLALANIFEPAHLVWLVIGVVLGTCIGIIPGVGGMAAMAILVPFVFGMDPISGLFLLVGLSSITETGDAFPAVLFGIPGGSSAQATVMDGYPLAKQGQAGRALGASFSAAMLGGILGALFIFAFLPIARPLVLALGTPEFFMLALVGLACVGVITQGYPLLGILSAIIGLALSGVGAAPTVVEYRFTFGNLQLQDGFSIIVLALGMFAIPEVLQLLTRGGSVAHRMERAANVWSGVRDSFRNFGLVARSSAIGIVTGMTPGVGGSTVQWICYGTASNSRKNKVPFGKGEIRGVIAPDSAVNANQSAGMIPTLLFGIPASAGAAVLLVALTLIGIPTGPRLLVDDGLVLLLSVMWALALANVIATSICLGLTKWMAQLTKVPMKAVAPFLLVVMFLASYQTGLHFGTIVQLLAFGLLGWTMINLRIPRAPALVGFAIGPAVERNLWISIESYGAMWLTRPAVVVIGLLLILVLWMGFRHSRRTRVEDRVMQQVLGTDPDTAQKSSTSSRLPRLLGPKKNRGR